MKKTIAIVVVSFIVSLGFAVYPLSANAQSVKEEQVSIEGGDDEDLNLNASDTITVAPTYKGKKSCGTETNAEGIEEDLFWEVAVDDDIEKPVMHRQTRNGFDYSFEETYSAGTLVDIPFRDKNFEFVVKPSPFDLHRNIISAKAVFSETGRWFKCGNLRFVPEGERVISPLELLIEAREQINPGPPVTEIPLNEDNRFVNLGIAISIDSEYWRQYSATATAGRVEITATMDPKFAVFSSGESGTRNVLCDFNISLDCSILYRTPSRLGSSHILTTNVAFGVTAESSVGNLGPQDDISYTSVQPIQVQELHAVNVVN